MLMTPEFFCRCVRVMVDGTKKPTLNYPQQMKMAHWQAGPQILHEMADWQILHERMADWQILHEMADY